MPHHSDITSHLNFKLFHKILKKNNLNVEKIITQNEFLKKIGILERANILSKKMTFKEKANMFYRLKRLIYPKEMGDRFKVIFAQKKATEIVFKRKKIPFRSFEIKNRSEKNLGQLFCFFILETILLGRSLNLNPFDQPAVELIKKETRKILL